MAENVLVIIGSTRQGRMTPRAAKLVTKTLHDIPGITVKVLDLRDLDMPFLTERLKYLTDPHPNVVKFSESVKWASVIIVTSPEYNGSCPGVLKNALDYLTHEYLNKKIGIVTVSAGPIGGNGCYSTLKTLFNRLGARECNHLKINRVRETLSADGDDVENLYQKLLREFLNSLIDNRHTND